MLQICIEEQAKITYDPKVSSNQMQFDLNLLNTDLKLTEIFKIRN